jgi:acyl phosphate:glycerol-3-phosphate acyltransferase
MGPALLNPALMALLALLFGYVLGSIPFGLILTRAAGLGDIRSIGSGNIGATNVLRTGNKWLAAVTLLFDVLKGTAAVLLAWLVVSWLTEGGSVEAQTAASAPLTPGAQLDWPQFTLQCAGLGAFLGHLFPVWLGFKGGKGVATYIGVLIGLAWKVAVIFCAVWLVVAFATRYSSLSALVASAAAPLAALVLGGWQLAAVTGLMSGLLIYKHEANIRRLAAGEESKIGGKTKG